MKAMQIHSYGSADVLSLGEAPMPDLRDDDVLIRVHAASINPIDWKTREGYLAGWFNHSLPLILGWDVSGTVEAVGPGVTEFSDGDEVFSRANISRNGAYAEYIAVPVSMVAHKPKSLDHIQTAALPNAVLAAWNALIEAADIQPGQTVLVHAAAGGVGTFAVQLAKWRGAKVIGTASPNNHEFLNQLGVDEVIDYNTTPFEEVVHDVDVVLDTVGGETQQRSWKTLKPGGMLVSIVEPPSAEKAAEFGGRAAFTTAEAGADRLNKVAALVDEGAVRPVVSAVYSLNETQEAHLQSQTMHTRGKLVLQVR